LAEKDMKVLCDPVTCLVAEKAHGFLGCNRSVVSRSRDPVLPLSSVLMRHIRSIVFSYGLPST